jgi:predicted nucleotidyltransferase
MEVTYLFGSITKDAATLDSSFDLAIPTTARISAQGKIYQRIDGF